LDLSRFEKQEKQGLLAMARPNRLALSFKCRTQADRGSDWRKSLLNCALYFLCVMVMVATNLQAPLQYELGHLPRSAFQLIIKSSACSFGWWLVAGAGLF
jgi:hypothetical protein